MKDREFNLTMSVTETQVDALVISSLQQSILDTLNTVQRAEDFSVILSILVVLEFYMDAEDWSVYHRLIMPDVKDMMTSFGVSMS